MESDKIDRRRMMLRMCRRISSNSSDSQDTDPDDDWTKIPDLVVHGAPPIKLILWFTVIPKLVILQYLRFIDVTMTS